MHVFAPYCNDANNFSLHELELILNFDQFTGALGSNTAGNIFQCLFKSGWIDCDSWLDIISEFGTDVVKLTDERKLRQKLGVGFEIWSGLFADIINCTFDLYFNNFIKSVLIKKSNLFSRYNFVSISS